MSEAGFSWYVGRDGQQQGPIDWAALKTQAASGTLLPSDLVWHDGMANWAYAVTIPGLIPTAPMLPLEYPPAAVGHLPEHRSGYAGFWIRFLAVILDALVMWVVNFVIGFIIGFTIAVAFTRNDQVAGAIAGLTGIAADWLYEVLMVTSPHQATLGKMALGIKVVGPEGERIGFGRATGRYFGKILSGLILMIGYLMMLWSDRRQTLHDSLAGTYLIKTRP